MNPKPVALALLAPLAAVLTFTGCIPIFNPGNYYNSSLGTQLFDGSSGGQPLSKSGSDFVYTSDDYTLQIRIENQGFGLQLYNKSSLPLRIDWESSSIAAGGRVSRIITQTNLEGLPFIKTTNFVQKKLSDGRIVVVPEEKIIGRDFKALGVQPPTTVPGQVRFAETALALSSVNESGSMNFTAGFGYLPDRKPTKLALVLAIEVGGKKITQQFDFTL
jgi:hypothetical protein